MITILIALQIAWFLRRIAFIGGGGGAGVYDFEGSYKNLLVIKFYAPQKC